MSSRASEAAAGPGWFGQPAGLRTLFFTEMWERFSYFGMRAFLIYFMVAPPAEGGLGFGLRRAGLVYGTYTMCVYLLAIPGGFAADHFLGARRAVLAAGLAIAAGHFALAFGSLSGFYLGLVLVAAGTGLLKPNMSTMVGALYAPGDPRRDAGFSIFYLGINLGAFIAPFVTGFLAQSAAWKACLSSWGFDPMRCWHWAFAAAGVGMLAGLLVYVLGGAPLARLGPAPAAVRPRAWGGMALVLAAVAAFLFYVDRSDRPGYGWMRSAYLIVPVAGILFFGFRRSLDGRRLAAVGVFFLGAMAFCAGLEQAGTTIALFCDRLTRTEVLGWPFPSAWFQALNPLFVILLAPAAAWLWMRLGDRQPSSPLKFVAGLGFLCLSLLLMVPAARLSGEGRVSPWWIVGFFFVQTAGEVCLSPVGLSAMTKLAPARLAGSVMGLWYLADALGNKLAGLLTGGFTAADPGALAWFFGRQALAAGACALAFLALSPWVRRLMGGVR